MADIFNWIGTHIGDICTGLCVVVLASSIIVKLTPTTKDDSFLRKVIKILDYFSLAKTADDKKYIEDAKKHLGEE